VVANANYLQVMMLALQHEYISEEELEELKGISDDWFYHYVVLVGLC
jgi:hypothetical protein